MCLCVCTVCQPRVTAETDRHSTLSESVTVSVCDSACTDSVPAGGLCRNSRDTTLM